MFLQGNTFAQEKNKLRRAVALCETVGYKGDVKGNGAIKKEELPTAALKRTAAGAAASL
ncbi:MAG: hypothetical protein LUD46_12240 [Parabacteroides sp.]|nr:hypothetical protein [Parabacteroides sp.]